MLHVWCCCRVSYFLMCRFLPALPRLVINVLCSVFLEIHVRGFRNFVKKKKSIKLQNNITNI